jgi:hypothetical protein
LREEGKKWQAFIENAGQGQLTNNIGEEVEVMAGQSAVRMVLATSTVAVLWGATATLSLKERTKEQEVREGQKWSRLLISVSPSGNGATVIRRQGLDIAKGIGELNGWPCEEDQENNGIVLTLPDFMDVV